jgi:hypothetical protein
MSNESAIDKNSARPISPAKLSHAVLRTTRLTEMVYSSKTIFWRS